MLEKCRNAQERWGGVHQLIDRWLQERHELISAYQQLQSQLDRCSRETLQVFCQWLVDYASAGHFEVYEQLLREAQDFNDQRGLELARQIYPRLQVITQLALDFNDRCDAQLARGEQPQLASELAPLGQLLHERFELEDCLIEVLHTARSEEHTSELQSRENLVCRLLL